MKSRLQLAAHMYPKRVCCNFCGWEGRNLLSTSWHLHTKCPRCGSVVRHRLLLAALTKLDEVSLARLAQGKRVLHFAPEPLLSGLLAGVASEYVTADVVCPGLDVRLDICDMEGVADASFDLVVACDVLEHVLDDSLALREIHRVPSSGGWAIVTVPQKDGLESTYEDPSITTPEARRQAFGQEDHLRMYGTDFDARVRAQGFSVTPVDEQAFNPEEARRHVLHPPFLSEHPLATNHRRIFFARKGRSAQA